MLNRFLKYYFSFACLFLFCEAAFAERKDKILVLHSYHQGLEWSDNISRGIRSVFNPLIEKYEIHYEYLDTKRNSGEAYTDQLLKFVASKYKASEYKAIIVSDNNALNLLNHGQISFAGNPAVIFCGINNFTEKLIDQLPNAAGVVEKADHQSNIELIKRLHPQSSRITIILDQTATGDAIRSELVPVEVMYPDLEFNFLRDFTLEEVDELLTSLGDDEPIYLLTFNRDRNNQFISYTEGIEMLNKSVKGPIYGAWDFYMGKGLVGGRIVSGYLQGAKAAEIALQVLEGDSEKDLNLIAETPTQYMFDHRYMEQHGIAVSALPPESEVIYSPEPVYKRYKNLFIGVSIVSLSAVLIMLWKFRTQKVLLKDRVEHGKNLERMVYERTMELEISNNKLQQLSNIDGLTQLYNRRYFDDALEKEINRCQRTATPLSLLMCDIDFFKKYNDTYGHLSGDDCIQLVADSIQKSCNRVADIAARYGGEEFAAILPSTDQAGAVEIANNIQLELAAKKIPFDNSELNDQLSLSIGIVTALPTIDSQPEELIAFADHALYESKHNGRNRVTVYKPE